MEKQLGQMIEQLGTHIPEKVTELEEILEYWEKIRIEWEKKKNEFWSKHNRDDFMKLLRYKLKHKKEIESGYRYLEWMVWMEKEIFVWRYLYDDMLYSLTIDETEKSEKKEYNYEDRKNWNVVMEEWVTLDLSENDIWNDWAEAIAKKIKLKEWVTLNLRKNKIWNNWAEAIAKNLELKNWVTLDLWYNQIWYEWIETLCKMNLKEWVSLNLSGNIILDDWAEVLSKMKLKEWVTLDLTGCGIWKKWIRALINNLEMKNGVVLDLSHNDITSEDLIWDVRDWESSCKLKWINCEIKI